MSAEEEPTTRVLQFSAASKELIATADEIAREYQLSHLNTAHVLLAAVGTEELGELFAEIGLGHQDKIQIILLPFLSYSLSNKEARTQMMIHGVREVQEGLRLAKKHTTRTGNRQVEPINVAAGLLQLPFSFAAVTLRRMIEREIDTTHPHEPSNPPIHLGIYRLLRPEV